MDVLTQARLAPSGANLQPGAFVWVRGEVREALTTNLVQAWRDGQQETEDYSYVPNPCRTPCVVAKWQQRKPCMVQLAWHATTARGVTHSLSAISISLERLWR